MQYFSRLILALFLSWGIVGAALAEEIECERADSGKCLLWDAGYFAFAPDSRSFLLSYRYKDEDGFFTPYISARVDLEGFRVEKIAAPSCGFSLTFPKISPDGKWLALIVKSPTVQKKVDGTVQFYPGIHTVGIIDQGSGSMFLIPDRSKKKAHAPFFSNDSKYLFFLGDAIGGEMLNAFDLRSRKHVGFFSKKPTVTDTGSLVSRIPFRSIRNIAIDGKGKKIVLTGRVEEKIENLLAEFAAKYRLPNVNLTIRNFAFELKLQDKSVRFHKINDALADDIRKHPALLGFSRVQLMRNGEIFYLKETPANSIESDQIYRFQDGKTAPFVKLKKPVIRRISTNIYAFVVSADRKWIAYKYKIFFGLTNSLDVVVLLDRLSGATRVLQLNSEVFQKFAASSLCRNHG